MAPADAKHCPGCGLALHGAAPRPEEASESGSKGACPRCHPRRSELVARELGGLAIDACTSCGGVFVATLGLDRLMKDGDQQAHVSTALQGASVAPTPAAVKAAEQVKYLPCPVCKNLMGRQNFGRSSGVIIDWCKSHGTWFDASELERVLIFVRAGGLDVARRREIEELEQKLKDRRREAAKPQPMGAFDRDQYRGNIGGPGVMDVVDVAVDLMALSIQTIFRR